MPPLVDDVQVKRHLDPAKLLDGVDGLCGSRIFGQGEDPGVHEAAGGPFAMLKDFGNFAGRMLAAHQLADLVGERFWKPVDQRRGVVRRKLLEEPDDFTGRARSQQRCTHIDAEFGDHLNRQPGVGGCHRIDGGPPLVIVEGAQNLGNVDRMPFLQQVQEVSGRTDAQQSSD
jgi:hypothetical protein